jgi:hypothetical protein
VVDLKETKSGAAWYIWWIRRRRTHNEDVPPLFKCKLSILTITANAKKAHVKPSADNAKRWTRPDPRFLKLNADASFNIEEMLGAAGAVLRDYEGKFRAASCTIISYVPNIEMSESIAVREGLKLAEQSDCTRLIVESDSLETIRPSRR